MLWHLDVLSLPTELVRVVHFDPLGLVPANEVGNLVAHSQVGAACSIFVTRHQVHLEYVLVDDQVSLVSFRVQPGDPRPKPVLVVCDGVGAEASDFLLLTKELLGL